MGEFVKRSKYPEPTTARNIAVSGRYTEWQTVKTPALRRGDENRPQPGILASTRLISTRPRNRSRLPQRGSREGRVPFIQPPGNRKVAGDFHRPYGNSEDLTFYHLSGHSPRGWVTDSRISLRPWCPASGSVLRKVRQTALPRLRDTHSLPSHSGSGSRHRPPARALQRPAASLQTH